MKPTYVLSIRLKVMYDFDKRMPCNQGYCNMYANNIFFRVVRIFSLGRLLSSWGWLRLEEAFRSKLLHATKLAYGEVPTPNLTLKLF